MSIRQRKTVQNAPIYYAYITTQIGKIVLTANKDQLIGLYIGRPQHFPIIQNHWQYNEGIALFTDMQRQLDAYFTSGRSYFKITYALYGTVFQKHIWENLTKIPYGRVCTYKAFSSLTAYPHAIRAVASAIASNPLSILLPCHRVIRSDGSLGGYAAGVAVKKTLLALEGGL